MRGIVRRGSLAVVSLILLAAACTGGAGEGGSQGGKELRIFLIPSPSATAIKAMIPDFERETGARVEVTEVPYGEAHQKQLLAFRTGQGQYDVVQFDNTFLANYCKNQVLAPLDGYVENSAEYDIQDFPESLRDYGDCGDTTYGLILSTEPFLLWYRTDIYDELGLTVPETWDQYLENARAIQRSGSAAGQLMGYASPVNTWWWMQLVWSFGGDLYDDQLNPTVDTPEAIAATKFYVETLDVAPDGAISVTGDDVTNLFISEDIGQMIQYSGYWPLVVDPETSSFPDKIAVARVPKGEADVIHVAGWNIGIPADSKNKDLAWRFLEFVLGKSNAKRFLEEGAAAPARISTTTDPELVKEMPFLPLLNIPSDVRVERYPQLAVWPEFEKACGDALANILSGQVSVEEGLAALQDQLVDVLAEERATA